MVSPDPDKAEVLTEPARAARGLPVDLLVGVGFATLVVLGFALYSGEVLHWFVLPVWACGVVVATEASRWVRGQYGLLDPLGLLPLLGVHFFFLSFLLHVSLDYWTLYFFRYTEARYWLGLLAALNFLGLMVYLVSSRVLLRFFLRKPRVRWKIQPRRAPWVLGTGLVVAGLVQAGVYARFGGLSGYLAAYAAQGKEAFQGLGHVFMVSESFPLLALILWVLLMRDRRWARSWPALLLTLAVFIGLVILFGGLRGSRGHTIWALAWAVGIVHLWVRPLPRRAMLAGAAIALAFMYFYGFYKLGGAVGAEALRRPEVRQMMAAGSYRGFAGTLLLDLARTDFQALLLHHASTDWRPVRGRTYLGGLSLLIPRALWEKRPPTKEKELTEIEYGSGTYVLGLASSRVAGLGGEAMLNFGPWALPPAYLLLGAFAALVSSFLRTWRPDDARLLLLPLLVVLSITLLVADSENFLFSMVKSGLMPFLAVRLSSRVEQL